MLLSRVFDYDRRGLCGMPRHIKADNSLDKSTGVEKTCDTRGQIRTTNDHFKQFEVS